MGRRETTRRSKHRLLEESEVEELQSKLRAGARERLTDSELSALAGIVETWRHLIEVAGRRESGMREIRRILGVRNVRDRNDSASGGGVPGEESQTEPESPAASEAIAADPVESPAGSSEDDAKPSPGPASSESAPKDLNGRKRHRHGRRSKDAFKRLEYTHHPHTALASGSTCPDCGRGHVYVAPPSEFTTIRGQAPLVAMRHVVDVLRCSLCKKSFKAPLPDELIEDGVEERPLYTFSAASMVTTQRFFAGLPMHRQGALQKALGVPVPDSSIWDMCERVSNALRPIARELHRRAACSLVFYGDDTGAKILDQRTALKKSRSTGKEEIRTGCHTTCVIGVGADDRAVTLFMTGIHHTGEVMDLILAQRDASLPIPVFMSDCLASNTVTVTPVVYAGCNSHAVRRFKDLVERYPEHAQFALSRYGLIFDNEARCRELGLDPRARRDLHQQHSRHLVREICEHGADLVEQRKMEPSSDIGAAYAYVIENERRLTTFARYENAPLENNRCERELRICVRLRETARFFRNSVGASVADTVLTVGATALAAEIELPDYFTAAQRYASDVRDHPELWVPWAYKDRVRDLKNRTEHASSTSLTLG